MTFFSIIRKNSIYNLNKYISFYFVNSLIITLLFVYGSLMFNTAIIDSLGKSSLYETIKLALFGIMLFSIIFISYTNVSFLKNRGKEFGMYLTLGMTTKDLIKLIFIENLVIMTAASVTGILGGTLFGRLFYMGLNKILEGTKIIYEFNFASILLSVGVFTLISLANFVFTMIYIKKVPLIEVIKSKQKKEIGKARILIGIIALMILIASMYCLPKALMNEIFKNQSYMIGVLVALTLLCPYMIIGSCISIARHILTKFPRYYNNNVIVLSNLSHRFLAYKNVLYMLSLLVAGAIFFMGASYAMYALTKENIDMNNPYDIMFVETSKYNRAEKEEIKRIISENSSQIERYSILEYLEGATFREEGEELSFWTDRQTVISESNYNKHMNMNVDVKANEAIYITVFNEKMDYEHPTSVLTMMNKKQLEKVREVASKKNYRIGKDDFQSIAEDTVSLYIDKDRIREEKNVLFTNYRSTREYTSGDAIVLNDKDYELLKNSVEDVPVKKLHLINVRNGDKAFAALIRYLKSINELDHSYWNEGILFGSRTSDDERGMNEAYRPVYKEELRKLQLDNNGMVLFTMIFIGLLFFLSNGVVLYYKVLSDIENEAERITILSRIGILEKEIKSLISKELAIILFVPMFVGGGIGLYYLYVMMSNDEMTGLFIKKACIVLLGGFLFQLLFYFISRKKYIQEVI